MTSRKRLEGHIKLYMKSTYIYVQAACPYFRNYKSDWPLFIGSTAMHDAVMAAGAAKAIVRSAPTGNSFGVRER